MGRLTTAEIIEALEQIEAPIPHRPWSEQQTRVRKALARLADRLRDDANDGPPEADPTLAAEVARLGDVATNLGKIVATHERWAEHHIARIAELTARLESQERYFAAEIARRDGP